MRDSAKLSDRAVVRERRSPLFSAVVLAGVSLTQAITACGKSTDEPPSTSRDPNITLDAGEIADAGSCPDGSERATPPCHFIR